MPGHVYLFSEELLEWEEARDMCSLLGGFLVQIESQHENNCILKFCVETELTDWWWSSGNDLETPGVYVQATGEEILWQPRWESLHSPPAYTALQLHTGTDSAGGAWRDADPQSSSKYICERILPPATPRL